VTENLIGRFASVEFAIDSYVFVKRKLDDAKWGQGKPSLDWPDSLSTEEQAVGWRCLEHYGWFDLDRTLPKRDHEG
jgi:hypothetical protein